MHKNKLASLLLGASIPLFGSTVILAQGTAKPQTSGRTASSNPAAADQSDAIGEIVVTAQRRSQSLLSVPLSITAASGEQLVDNGIQDISQLQFTTPGLVPNNGTGYVQVFIRGVGNTIFVGADPSVATFIDDVPRIYGSLVSNFVNVERVEILKGAQGGLYGRNATGGVINIITRQPSDTFATDARVSYGTKNTLQAAAYLNAPWNDHVAWNLSVERDSHDPYVKNLFQTRTPYTAAMFPNGSPIGTPEQTADFLNSGVNPPDGLGRSDFWAADTKLRLNSDKFKLTLSGDYARKNDDAGDEIYQALPDSAQALDTAILSSFGITAVLPPGFIQKPPGKFQAYKGVQDDASLTDYGGSATAVYNAPGVDITSITAYRAQETHYFDDQTGIAPSALTADIKLRKHYFYQELRAISTSEGRFHFLGGASYLRTHTDGNSIIGYYPPLFTQTPTTSTGGVKNWSVYGQLGYDLTDHLNLTASGRYIHETNRVDFTSPVTASSEVSASKFLPSATLSYSLASGGNVYARYAKGFKAGGVNSVDPPTAYPTDFGKVFAPEQIDTYEIGYRAPLFDRTMQLTTAVFYNDYTGIQTFTNGNPSHPGIIFAIINSGSARTYGAESSLTWRVTSPFTLGVNASYLNARYKQFGNSDGAVLNTFDFSGRKMLFSPTWQLALTGDVDYPINDRCNFIANALVSYTDDIKFFNSAVQGIPDPIQPAYWLTNVRVGMRTSDDRYRVTLFANNLFNRGYVTLGQASAFGDLYRWGNPRIVGIEVRAKY